MPSKLCVAVGGATIAVTTIVALLLVPAWTTMALAGLIGMLWAETALFGGFCLVGAWTTRRSSLIARVGGGTAIAVYAVVCFTLSAVFAGAGADALPLFLSIQLIALLAAGIACAAFFMAERAKRRDDDRDAKLLDDSPSGTTRRGGF